MVASRGPYNGKGYACCWPLRLIFFDLSMRLGGGGAPAAIWRPYKLQAVK